MSDNTPVVGHSAFVPMRPEGPPSIISESLNRELAALRAKLAEAEAEVGKAVGVIAGLIVERDAARAEAVRIAKERDLARGWVDFPTDDAVRGGPTNGK